MIKGKAMHNSNQVVVSVKSTDLSKLVKVKLMLLRSLLFLMCKLRCVVFFIFYCGTESFISLGAKPQL